MKSMLRISSAVILFVIVFIAGNKCYSQSLQFCENVTQNGAPVKASSLFYINGKGGYIYFLTTLPYRVGTKSVSYEIYGIDPDGNESYESTINQEVDDNRTWFAKDVTFYEAGRFNIYVYDGDRNFLTSSQVTIQYY